MLVEVIDFSSPGRVRHIANGLRTPGSSYDQRHLLKTFIDPALRGDMPGLENLFAEDLACKWRWVCSRRLFGSLNF